MSGRGEKKLMRFAYADPPYLGQGRALYSHDSRCDEYDSLEAHGRLLLRLSEEFPDGWAYSLSSTTLRLILPLAPEGVRVMAWVKPFASFKPNVNPAYAWEPVLVMGGRVKEREEETVRDWVSAPITLERGLAGAKPDGFLFWLLNVLGVRSGDEVVDLFPGTGAMASAVERWNRQSSLF